MLRLSSLTLYMRVHGLQGLLMYTKLDIEEVQFSARCLRTCFSRIPVSDPTPRARKRFLRVAEKARGGINVLGMVH